MVSSTQISAFAILGKKLPQDDLVHVFNSVDILWENFRRERIFITGGTGFLGKWLLESLLYANQRLDLECQITVLSRNPMGFAENYPHLSDPEIVSFVTGDVRNYDYPEGQYKFIIHAATDVATHTMPIDLFFSCVDGTKRVLDFAHQAGCSNFLLVSSGAVYGCQPSDLAAIPENFMGAPDLLSTKSAYGEGKRCAEWLTNTYGMEHNFNVSVARCFAFVGPHLPLDKHFAIGNFIHNALSDSSIFIQGDGTAIRSYLYAADLVTWLWTILLSGRSGETYNVGGDNPISISDLARLVNFIAGSQKDVKVMTPFDPSKRPDCYVPDIHKARTELGLKCLIPLDDAIRRTIQWLKVTN